MRVFLIAKSQPIWLNIDKWLEQTRGIHFRPTSTHCSEALVELSGRVCYDSFAKPRPGGTQAYIENIIKSGHGSVLEHAVYTFAIHGISRACSHELVRHRAGFSYSQRSQRYCDEAYADFVVRDDILDADLKKMICDHFQQSLDVYDRIVTYCAERDMDRKASRSLARYVLPEAVTTEIVVTANARAWRHFLETRGSRHADWEIRKLANVIRSILVEDSPNIFGDLIAEPLGDGTCEITTENRKV